MLDWVSTEDGGHVLTVAVGAKVLLYAAVSAEVAQSTHKDNKSDSRTPRRGILQKSKSMTVSNVVEEIRWMKVGFILKNLDFCLLKPCREMYYYCIASSITGCWSWQIDYMFNLSILHP